MADFTYLELNDWQLSVYNTSGDLLSRQPAAALSDNSHLVFGKAAQERSRTDPQRFNQRYFSSISADPLGTDMGPARNHADLVYHHLRDLALGNDVVVGIPGHFSNEQLGLLLGICSEAGLTVTGFVESALAHSLSAPVGQSYQVLDIELHRFTLSNIEIDGTARSVVNTTAIDAAGGVANIIERWMNIIADDMVRKTRFDPLHTGVTEQQVYNQVCTWFGAADLQDKVVSIDTREHEVSAQLLAERLDSHLKGLDIVASKPLLVTERIDSIPGLMTHLRSKGYDPIVAEVQELGSNVLQLSGQLDSENITRVTSAQGRASTTRKSETQAAVTQLASSNGANPAPVQTATRPSQAGGAGHATHLLSQYHAYAFNDARFAGFLDPVTGAVLDPEVVTNGVRSVGLIPSPGDELRVGERRYIAIRME